MQTTNSQLRVICMFATINIIEQIFKFMKLYNIHFFFF